MSAGPDEPAAAAPGVPQTSEEKPGHAGSVGGPTRTLPSVDEARADGRLVAPSALRNIEPIGKALAPLLAGRSGLMLEIGSGTGQHAADWAERFPALDWQPSDVAASHRESIAAWVAASARPNLHPPITLNARAPWPDLRPLTGIIAVNVIHIAPWAVAEAIVAAAGARLAPGGLLILYGPFRRGGQHTAESNAAFDASLKARDPDWGVRDLDDVAALASASGLAPPSVTEMPANNLTVAFAKA